MIGNLFEVCDIFYMRSHNCFLLLVNAYAPKHFDISELLEFKAFECSWYRSRVLLVKNNFEASSAIVNLHHHSHLLIELCNRSSDHNNLSYTLPTFQLQVIFGPYRTLL